MKQHEILKKYITGLTKGYANSLIIVSKAGYGKTETTIETLKELGIEKGKQYLYLNNYITPVELYQILMGVNALQEPKILVLDDIEDTLRNLRAIGLLKGALWEVNGKRQVSWYSGTYKIKEKSFDFQGKIIFLLNQFNRKNPVLNALRDRGLYYQMDLSVDEMIKLMDERAKIPYQNIPYHKRKEIITFIQKVAGKSQDITLRLLPKAYNLYLLSPNHYKDLITTLL